MVIGIKMLSTMYVLASGLGHQSVVSDTVLLHFRSASEMVRLFDGQGGRDKLEKLNINVKANSVEVVGSRSAVDAFKSFVKDKDRQVKLFSISSEVYKVSVDKLGTVAKQLISSPNVTTTEGQEAEISETGGKNLLSLRYTPKTLGNGSVSTQVVYIIKNQATDADESFAGDLQLVPGETKSSVGLLITGSSELRKRIRHGEIVKDSGPYSAIYFETKLVKIQ